MSPTMPKPNKRYTAVILYVATAPALDEAPLYEEEVVLIEAHSEAEAKHKAIEYAKQQETSYKNGDGETIVNTFKGIVDVQRMIDAEMAHGSTLYVRHFRDYQAYESFEPMLKGEPL